MRWFINGARSDVVVEESCSGLMEEFDGVRFEGLCGIRAGESR